MSFPLRSALVALVALFLLVPATLALAQPDLSVSAGDGPAKAQKWRPTATVSNLGSADSPASKVTFYVDEVLVGEGKLRALKPGRSATVSGPSTYVGLGAHEVRAVVDAVGAIPETDEANNEAVRSFTVAPDLVASAVHASAGLVGEKVPLSADVVYTGSGKPPTNGRLRFIIDGAYYGKEIPIKFAKGSTTTTVLGPSWTPGAGKHIVRAVIDAGHKVFEVDELNNEAQTRVRITDPAVLPQAPLDLLDLENLPVDFEGFTETFDQGFGDWIQVPGLLAHDCEIAMSGCSAGFQPNLRVHASLARPMVNFDKPLSSISFWFKTGASHYGNTDSQVVVTFLGAQQLVMDFTSNRNWACGEPNDGLAMWSTIDDGNPVPTGLPPLPQIPWQCYPSGAFARWQDTNTWYRFEATLDPATDSATARVYDSADQQIAQSRPIQLLDATSPPILVQIQAVNWGGPAALYHFDDLQVVLGEAQKILSIDLGNLQPIPIDITIENLMPTDDVLELLPGLPDGWSLSIPDLPMPEAPDGPISIPLPPEATTTVRAILTPPDSLPEPTDAWAPALPPITLSGTTQGDGAASATLKLVPCVLC